MSFTLGADDVRSPEFQAMYLELMEELAQQGGEVAATKKNAAFFCNVLADLTAAGKAAVVAAVNPRGEIVGFGGAYSTGFEAASGGQLWSALGTYVEPKHRGQGYGRELREGALAAAKKAGASCATTGRYAGQTEGLHPSMAPIQTLYLVRL